MQYSYDVLDKILFIVACSISNLVVKLSSYLMVYMMTQIFFVLMKKITSIHQSRQVQNMALI